MTSRGVRFILKTAVGRAVFRSGSSLSAVLSSFCYSLETHPPFARLFHVHIHRQLTENNIRLRPVRMFDALFILSGFVSDDFLTANGLTRPITSSWLLMWWWIKKTFTFSYCILVNGKHAGFIGLHNMQPCASAEMSLALFEKNMKRKGYGARAFHLFVHDLEKHQFAENIVVRVDKDNFISLSFWKKLGFKEIHREDGVRTLLYVTRPSSLSNGDQGTY